MPEPTEAQIQEAVCQALNANGVLYCHPANGGHRHKAVAAKLKRQGVKPGVPDLLIFDPPFGGEYVGAAIELKTTTGKLSEHQIMWLRELMENGWYCKCCYGLDAALATLKELGYL